MDRDVCPHCEATLQAGDGYYKTLGVVVPGVYDGALYWQCPFCEGTWHRWAPGTRLWTKARWYIND